MTTCLVPDLAAVKIALEHLGDLDKTLREEGGSFNQETSHHLTELAEAIRELELSRKAARERLEVATIETSRLRHGMIHFENETGKEISDNIKAARAANYAKIDQLQTEMKTVEDHLKSMKERQHILEQENAVFIYEKDTTKESYNDVVYQMNQHLSKKVGMQMELKDKQTEIQTIHEQIIQVEMTQKDLQEMWTLNRKAFAEDKHSVVKKVEEIVLYIKEQRKLNGEKHKELDKLTSELHDKDEIIVQSKNQMSQMNKNIHKLSAIKISCTEKIVEAISQAQEVEKQKDILEQEQDKLSEQFTMKLKAFQHQLQEVENELKDEWNVKSGLSEKCSKVSDIFSTRKKEEDEMIAQLNHLSKQLEESKKQNDEDITTTAKCRYEIKNMKKAMRQLQDDAIINADIFKKSLEDLEGQLANQKLTRSKFEAKRANISKSLKTLKEEDREFTKAMNSAILQTEKRYRELLKEERKLQDHKLLNSMIEDLTKELAVTEKEEKLMETDYQAELQKFATEEQSITQALTEKEQALKLQESALEELESQFNSVHLRHLSLKNQITEFETQMSQLELSIKEVIQQTTELIQPKDELKKQLVALREKQMEALNTNAAEISSVEKKIYENKVLLEQVTMENSRLHVCIEQMKEDCVQAEKDRQKHLKETECMVEKQNFFSKSLMETWTISMLLTEESAEQDLKVLEDIYSLIRRIQGREQTIRNINITLEKELLGIGSMLKNSI